MHVFPEGVEHIGRFLIDSAMRPGSDTGVWDLAELLAPQLLLLKSVVVFVFLFLVFIIPAAAAATIG
jgi:hypothetical protein